jgi:imidazoleglycerol-phosphate dehydratase
MRSQRIGEIKRDTKETKISLAVNLDGTGTYMVRTPVPFFTHMLEQFAKHGGFDLTVSAEGDVDIDYHHTVEDVGICLGQALVKALGDKKGIRRYGECTLPMQEALIRTSLDFCGRAHLTWNIAYQRDKVGTFDVELVQEFFIALINNAGITAHVDLLRGENTHHIVEGTFKSFTRALAQAVGHDERLAGVLPSTKGLL